MSGDPAIKVFMNAIEEPGFCRQNMLFAIENLPSDHETSVKAEKHLADADSKIAEAIAEYAIRKGWVLNGC